MPSRKALPHHFVDIHGRPFKGGGETTVGQMAKAQREQDAGAALQPQDLERIFDALVLAGWRRGKTALVSLLKAFEWRHERGAAYDGNDVQGALRRLVAAGRVRAVEGEGWTVPEAAAEARLGELLRQPGAAGWWRGWVWAAGGAYGRLDGPPPLYAEVRNEDEAVALLRLVLCSGIDVTTYLQLSQTTLQAASMVSAMLRVLPQLLRLQLLEQVDARIIWRLLAALDAHGVLGSAPTLMRWAEARIDDAPPDADSGLRLRIAEQRLHRGDGDGMRRALRGASTGQAYASVFEALLPAHAGRFDDVAAAFPPAWKSLTAALGKRRDLATMGLLQWYLLSLMASHDPGHWTLARKFAVSQSGSRTPSPFDGWGRWAHALAVRLGDERLEPDVFDYHAGWDRQAVLADRVADLPVMAAWVGQAPAGWTPQRLQRLSDGLHAGGLSWKADLLAQACTAFGWPLPARPADAPPPWPVKVLGPRQDAWREALAAITALGGQRSATVEQPVSTLRWQVSLDDELRIADLQALELPATARGKAKPLSLLQLKRRTRLDPRDAAVARCLRQSRYNTRELSLDLVQAALALQGHPAVVFDDAPDVAVEFTEGLPVLEVRRERVEGGAEHFVFRLQDRLLADEEPLVEQHITDYEELDAEARRRDGLRIVRDTPERARLIRVTPAQRRVAELVAQRWTVPADAGAELEAALRVLSGHFVLHSDAEAGERVPSDARLVAQLQPRGDALQLLLAVRPFGGFGPLLPPGQGRARLLTQRAGVSLATERALDAERAHLAAVTERLPFLAEAADGSWLLEDPEQALSAVHHLGQMAAAGTAVRALEWPKGRPVRVLAPEAGAFSATLASRRGWFELQGELQVDEGRVLGLQKLLALLRDAQGGRYVALGEGQYLLLAEQLRQRLADLEALAEEGKAGLKLGAGAGAWLADAAGDLGLTGDAAWRERAAMLERAAALQPAVPAGLQADLRPYQAEGHAWMMRLAEGGFGAILADDMGLGKTVQTLALLLSRAGQGPALVVAPTSVCDNWAAEAARFAPALSCSVHGRGHGEGGRTAQLAEAGAGDVIVVSYALLLRDAEAFAARPWATLVLDEAQALKNAATQRVQAVAGLEAGFRLALSGTPVENRLSDLWSIMNLVNPGLLGSAARFAERFANPIERQRSEAARARLRRLVAPFLLRRTKAQVLADLPPRTEIVERVEPADDERALLEAMRRDALARIAQLDPADAQRQRFNVLAELTRLRRAACDPRLAAPEFGRPGAKVQAFERLATELVEARHQALVFSQFTDFLKLLAERLDAAGLRYRYLDGATPAAARAERVASFQRGEADLFLISLKAGGFGLNLTAADYVVIADPWWNPAAEDQAMGRAHRIGQQRPVTVYRLVTAGSVEERIVALHQDKRELAEGLLAGQDGGAPVSAAELVALLNGAD